MDVIHNAIQSMNVTAVLIFFLFVIVTLVITGWAARHMKSTKHAYSAGGEITALQNGLAITGDYVSAASFLGISALVFSSGYDGLIYSIGFLVGWPIVILLIAEPLRNLGRYNFSDVASYRFDKKPIRVLAACGSLTTVLCYLIAQMVGAGKLIETLFGLPYVWAVVIVGVLMITYVTFGGMLATTWVQLIKAVLILFGATAISFLVLKQFNFSLEGLFRAAVSKHAGGETIMAPGNLIKDPISAISLGLGLMFGTAGLPHILMRFFTVKNVREANRSVFFATGFIGYFYVLTFIIGFGAIAFLTGDGRFVDSAGKLIGGNNMAAVHLAHAVGGDFLYGFISAVAFSTILAVVAGLALAGASAISHDLFANVFSKGDHTDKKELKVMRIASIGLGILAMYLGIEFEKVNVAFMVGLAFSVAASANFPIILMSIYWKKMTTRGALFGGALGLITAVVLVVLAKTVWVNVFGFEKPIFPYEYPALFSMTAAFVGIWLFSVTDKSARGQIDRDAFEAQFVKAQTGVGGSVAKGVEQH